MGFLSKNWDRISKVFSKVENAKQVSSSDKDLLNTTVKESLNFQQFLKNVQLGAFGNKFISDVYKERILYPHDEMEISKKAHNYNSYLQAGVRSRASFAVGGEIIIVSNDPRTERELRRLFVETGLSDLAHQQMFQDSYKYGNFYAERIRDASKRIIAYLYINTPEKMYHILDNSGVIKDFFLEYPPEFLKKGQYETIKYYGDRRKPLRGKRIPKEKVLFFKYDVGEIPTYGRGLIAAVVNDAEILLEIERSIAVISRYKAIPKKLLMLTNSDNPKDADYIGNYLNTLRDDENPIIPFDLKVEDLSYSGKDVNFVPIVDYLKRKLTVSLAPSFIIHGDETNYAVSREQKTNMILNIQQDRAILKSQLIREIKRLAESNSFNYSEFDIEFGRFDIGQDDDVHNQTRQNFLAGLLTRNEAREMLGYDPDKETGDFYRDELQIAQQSTPDYQE